MASPLQQAGASTEPSSLAALHTNRVFTGLWTNRSPLRDAATSYLQEKYYSASRQDSIWAGLNTELSSKLTLRRRPGQAVYNSQTFPAVQRFFEFRKFSTKTSQIRIIADTAAAVYDATGPNGKTLLWTKSAGAGATSFVGVGNILHMGNGVDQVKYLGTLLSWSAGATFSLGDWIIDPAGNIQTVAPTLSAYITSAFISGGVLTLTLTTPNPFIPGMAATVAGATGAWTFLNGTTMTVSGTTGSSLATMSLAHANLNSSPTMGTLSTPVAGATGGSEPGWASTPGTYTLDAGVVWVCRGPATQGWGIAAPTIAPSVISTALPAVYPPWQGSTVYSPLLAIVDSNGNVQQLTQSGTTGSAQPAWATVTGATTADGSAIWTMLGGAGWQPAHAYAVGDIISASFVYYVQVYHQTGNSPGYYTQQSVTVTDNFRCTQAGVSGASQPAWVDGNYAQVPDNTMVWTNVGNNLTWAGTIGAGTAVYVSSKIIDTNGNVQQSASTGKTGTAQPTWAGTQTGATTYDGTLTWTNLGPYSAANTGAWIYSYAFGNSLSGEKSNTSPLSGELLLAKDSGVTVQGYGSADRQVDTIHLYRTVQGGSTQMFLASFPAPANGGLWTYVDTSTDDGLNELIQGATALQLSPPPVGAIAPAYHLQRVFVAVENVVSWSAGPDAVIFAANGNSGFPPDNYFVLPNRVVRLWPCALGLMVFTVSDTYLIAGTAISSDPLYIVPFLEGMGLLSYDGFAVHGSTAYLLTNSLMLVSLDPGAGVTEVGFPIADQIQANFGTASHLTFHSQTSSDTALYAGDGLLGWYRMSATSAPESGFAWSPQAMLTGGCVALASLETSPGVNQLLMSQIGGGPILCRSLSTNTDAGTPFVAWATFGSIVMAQPGQLAGLRFITLESTIAGSRPQLAVLLGEISGTFEALPRRRRDPPRLPPSTTIRADRIFLAQNEKPTFCRHFQMRVGWPAEDAANELLTYTIFGELWSEFRDQ